MMDPLTLEKLAVCFANCKRMANPHREPDFPSLARIAKDGWNTIVRGRCVFIEEHNTGWDGCLNRWMFTITTVNNAAFSFQCDLMPDQLIMGTEWQGDQQ